MKNQIGFCFILILLCANQIVASDEEIKKYLEDQEQKNNFPLKHLDYKQIIETFYSLEQEYPHYIKVYDAAKNFTDENFPQAFCKDNQNKEGNEKCKFIYAVVTNYSDPKHANFTQSFFSGNFHGDEVVGPNILTYMTKHILEKPDLNILSKSYIVILPMSNPQGYSYDQREECSIQNSKKRCIDINRDFPYDNNEDGCFQSAGARVINYIWQRHLFSAAITFHGGMTAIGWPWGSKNHVASYHPLRAQISPDHNAFYALGKRMSEVGGQYPNIPKYDYNALTDIVYPVNGSFEDWSYAASWERQIDPKYSSSYKCKGISEQEMQINDNVARSLTYLIETTDQKSPGENTYGTWAQISSSDKGQGHVTRNIRLTLDFINNLSPSYDLATRKRANYTFYVKWAVEGCQQVSYTKLLIREKNSSNSNTTHNNYNSLQQLLDDGFQVYKEYTSYLGKISDVTSFKSQIIEFEDQIERTIDIAVVSECDSFLTNKKEDANPTKEPQSHFVRSRLNDSYLAENNGFFINNNKYIIQALGPFLLANTTTTPIEPDELDSKDQASSNYDYLIVLFIIITIGSLLSYCIYKKFNSLGKNHINFQEIHDDDNQLQQLPNQQQLQQLQQQKNKQGGPEEDEL